MIALIQRVRQASVTVDGRCIGEIGQGLLVFCGFQPLDSEVTVSKLLERIVNYRVFADSDDKMNYSLRDIQGGLLLVPQFTLAADTERGRRPSFTTAAAPEQGRLLFDYLLQQAVNCHEPVASGEFGADMQVLLQNSLIRSN